MSEIVSAPSRLVNDLVKALGLDPYKVKSLSLHLRRESLVIAEVTLIAYEAEIDQVVEVMKEYYLTERTELPRIDEDETSEREPVAPILP